MPASPFPSQSGYSKAKAQRLAEARQYLDEVEKRQKQGIEPDEEFIQRGLQILKAGNSHIKTSEQLIESLNGRVSTLSKQTLPLTTRGFRSDLDDRIALAQSQGFVWNKSGAKPTKQKTIEHKLSEWETNFASGRNFTDFSSLSESDFDTKPKAFIAGVCEAIEEKLGIGRAAEYLRPRFRTVLKQYSENNNPN